MSDEGADVFRVRVGAKGEADKWEEEMTSYGFVDGGFG